MLRWSAAAPSSSLPFVAWISADPNERSAAVSISVSPERPGAGDRVPQALQAGLDRSRVHRRVARFDERLRATRVRLRHRRRDGRPPRSCPPRSTPVPAPRRARDGTDRPTRRAAVRPRRRRPWPRTRGRATRGRPRSADRPRRAAWRAPPRCERSLTRAPGAPLRAGRPRSGPCRRRRSPSSHAVNPGLASISMPSSSSRPRPGRSTASPDVPPISTRTSTTVPAGSRSCTTFPLPTVSGPPRSRRSSDRFHRKAPAGSSASVKSRSISCCRLGGPCESAR